MKCTRALSLCVLLKWKVTSFVICSSPVKLSTTVFLFLFLLFVCCICFGWSCYHDGWFWISDIELELLESSDEEDFDNFGMLDNAEHAEEEIPVPESKLARKPPLNWKLDQQCSTKCYFTAERTAGVEIPSYCELCTTFEKADVRPCKIVRRFCEMVQNLRKLSFMKLMLSMWKVKFNPDDWTASTCTCLTFQKQYYWKHWVGVAIKKKVLFPSSTSTVISVKPARGRPKDRENPQSEDSTTNGQAAESQPKRGRGRPKRAGPGLAVEPPPSSSSNPSSYKTRTRPST